MATQPFVSASTPKNFQRLAELIESYLADVSLKAIETSETGVMIKMANGDECQLKGTLAEVANWIASPDEGKQINL